MFRTCAATVAALGLSLAAHAAPVTASYSGTVCSLVTYSNGWARVNLNSKADCTGTTTQIYLCSKSAVASGCGVHGDDFADAAYNALILALRDQLQSHLSASANCWTDTNTCNSLGLYNF